MSEYVITWRGKGLDDEDARRFRRIWISTTIPILVLGAAAGLYTLSETVVPPAPITVDVPQRVRLLPPPPKPILRPLPAPVPHPSKQVVARSAPARQRPARSAQAAPRDPRPAGGFAVDQLHSQLAAFHDLPSRLITSNQSLTNAPLIAQAEGRGAAGGNAMTRGAASGSGGVGRATTGIAGGSDGFGLGERHGPRVAGSGLGSGRGTGAGEGAGGEGNALQAARTLKEVQWIFDRDKSGFAALFSSVARQTPGMEAGKIVVNLTIAPDGVVTKCTLVSSSFGNAQLERLILERIKLLNFGIKPVQDFHYANYPLNFLLS